jgi:Domain of unknown function (DUF5060)/Putative collagen-binding domain of a collagenase/Protein of unknown function (DUF4038)/Dolichyl-phosphate-mannose-protein mannosyltransferase
MDNCLHKSRYWLGWAAALVLIVTFVWLANDGRHHWHEFRHLYSATFYSVPELMQGVFDPGPAPVRTPEEVATWYVSELFHVYVLRQLVGLFGMGLDSYMIIKTLYAMMVVTAVGLVWKTLRDLGMSLGRSVLIAGLLLFSPLSIYLGFKFMGEVPSLFFSACALALFTSGTRKSHFRSQAVLSGLAGLSLALSMLASAKMPLLFLGFWAALLVVWVPREMKRSVIRAGIISGIIFLVSVPVGLGLLGGSLNIYLDAFTAFLGFAKPLPMWMFAIFNLGLFGMGLWLLLPLAWLSRDQRCRRFFLVWLAVSGVPILFTTANFLEPRYLATAVVPFVGLAALGFEALWLQLRALKLTTSFRAVIVTLLAAVVIGGTAVAQPLMPYESNTNRLIQAVDSESGRPDSAVIFVPWNYSDFHFLRFAFPERHIYLVQSAAHESGEILKDPIWTARFAAMYLPSAEHFPAEFSQRRLLYIGWTILPSLQNLRELFMSFGFTRLAGYLEASGFRNHMTESWLVHDSRFAMRELSQYGQYQVYEVRYRRPFAAPNQTASLQFAPIQEIPLWGMFETSILNDRKYTNPFIDTELEATFISSSGKTHDFFGFYDGDGNGGQTGSTWKLRFMCIEIGTWHWSAAFTDGTPGGSGSFRCTKSSLPGPLQVDKKNPQWLKKANGGHFLPRWYYLHELLFTKEGIWQQDVDNLLLKNRYNMVTVLTTQAETLVSNGWNRREYERPFFYPWITNGGTVLWNKKDLASWRKLDRVLQYLAARNIYVYFFDGLFPNIAPRFPDNPIKERAYLRYALARIGAYWNVTHNITFEFSEFMPAARLNRIGRYLREIDPFNLLLTVHDTQDFDILVQREEWIDSANLQYDAGRAGTASISNAFALAHHVGKPLLSTEVVWEGGDKLNGDQVRRGAWGVLLAGSFFLYGEFNLGGIGVGNFGLGAAHPFLKIMFDFMESIPYWTMRPHNELVDRGQFCLANPGKEYIVYAETGGVITVDLSAASETLPVEWLNPRTGQRTPAGTVTGGTRQSFKPPHETTDGDWVLHVGGSSQPRGKHASTL